LALTLTVTVSVVGLVMEPELLLLFPEPFVGVLFEPFEVLELVPAGLVVVLVEVDVVVDDEELEVEGAGVTGVSTVSVFCPLVLAILVAMTNFLLAEM